jgi:hypothetical protein
MLQLWQQGGCPHKTDGPDGLWLHQAAVEADLPFLKAMGRYNADWDVLENGTGRSALTLIVLRARALGQPFVVYVEDFQSPQQSHYQQRSLTGTLRWCGCHKLPPTLLRALSTADHRPRLLQRGANPNLKDKFNSAPLQYAVQPQRQFDGMEASPIMVDMAKLLLEYGGLCET